MMKQFSSVALVCLLGGVLFVAARGNSQEQGAGPAPSPLFDGLAVGQTVELREYQSSFQIVRSEVEQPNIRKSLYSIRQISSAFILLEQATEETIRELRIPTHSVGTILTIKKKRN